MSNFEVSASYEGYVFVGWAAGRMDPRDPSVNSEKIPYYNMYVVCPVSSYQSEDYQAFGLKAEKKKCISADVWKDLTPGDRVKLFFDDKQRVVMAALDQ